MSISIYIFMTTFTCDIQHDQPILYSVYIPCDTAASHYSQLRICHPACTIISKTTAVLDLQWHVVAMTICWHSQSCSGRLADDGSSSEGICESNIIISWLLYFTGCSGALRCDDDIVHWHISIGMLMIPCFTGMFLSGLVFMSCHKLSLWLL